MTSKYCKVWVKSAQVSFLSLWKLTGPPQAENNQWKKKTQHLSQKTALVSTHLPARISSQDHDKSSSAIPQNILTAAPDVWLTLSKASLWESFPCFGRTHSLHGSLKSSQGLAHNTYTQCQNTQLISQIYIWNLFFLELPFNCPCSKENFCRDAIFMPVRFTFRLFLHSWNL